MSFEDKASDQELASMDEAIQNEVRKDFNILEPMGECHFCFEPVEGVKLFCNGIHASEYDRMKKMQNGRYN